MSIRSASADYGSAYLRRKFREGGKVRGETVASLSALPEHVLEVIRRSLAGEALVPAAQAATITCWVPHGHVAAVWAQAIHLGLPGPCWGRPGGTGSGDGR